MNDLYFFFKISRKHPCSHGFAPGQRHIPGRFPACKGLRRPLFRPARRVFSSAFPARHAVPAQKRTCPVSCTAPLPFSHQVSQQLDIFFLCVPHRSHKAVQGRFQNERVRCRKGLTPARWHAAGYSAPPGRLFASAARRSQQRIRLPGKVGIRRAAFSQKRARFSSAAALTLRRAGRPHGAGGCGRRHRSRSSRP